MGYEHILNDDDRLKKHHDDTTLDIPSYRNFFPECTGNRLYVDIGASTGSHVRRALKHFRKIVAFEPHPCHFEKLWSTFIRWPKVRVYNRIVSDKKGHVFFKALSPNNAKKSSVDKDVVKSLEYRKISSKEIEVETVTLDQYNLEGIDYLKIDVEGHEYEVLKGAVETLKKNSPFIKIELFSKPNECLELLRSLGYECVGVEMFGATSPNQPEDLYRLDGEKLKFHWLEYPKEFNSVGGTDGEWVWECGDFRFDEEKYKKVFKKRYEDSIVHPLYNHLWGDLLFAKKEVK